MIRKRKITRKIKKGASRIPENSVFYRKVVPAMVIGMVVITLVLILIAAGVLIGFIPFL